MVISGVTNEISIQITDTLLIGPFMELNPGLTAAISLCVSMGSGEGLAPKVTGLHQIPC